MSSEPEKDINIMKLEEVEEEINEIEKEINEIEKEINEINEKMRKRTKIVGAIRGEKDLVATRYQASQQNKEKTKLKASIEEGEAIEAQFNEAAPAIRKAALLSESVIESTSGVPDAPPLAIPDAPPILEPSASEGNKPLPRKLPEKPVSKEPKPLPTPADIMAEIRAKALQKKAGPVPVKEAPGKIVKEQEGPQIKLKVSQPAAVDVISDPGYDLCLMSELPQSKKPEKGKLYLTKQDNKLKYIVLSPKGEVIEGKLDVPVQGELTKEFLDKKKSEILKITSERGHTPDLKKRLLNLRQKLPNLRQRLPNLRQRFKTEEEQYKKLLDTFSKEISGLKANLANELLDAYQKNSVEEEMRALRQQQAQFVELRDKNKELKEKKERIEADIKAERDRLEVLLQPKSPTLIDVPLAPGIPEAPPPPPPDLAEDIAPSPIKPTSANKPASGSGPKTDKPKLDIEQLARSSSEKGIARSIAQRLIFQYQQHKKVTEGTIIANEPKIDQTLSLYSQLPKEHQEALEERINKFLQQKQEQREKNARDKEESSTQRDRLLQEIRERRGKVKAEKPVKKNIIDKNVATLDSNDTEAFILFAKFYRELPEEVRKKLQQENEKIEERIRREEEEKSRKAREQMELKAKEEKEAREKKLQEEVHRVLQENNLLAPLNPTDLQIREIGSSIENSSRETAGKAKKLCSDLRDIFGLLEAQNKREEGAIAALEAGLEKAAATAETDPKAAIEILNSILQSATPKSPAASKGAEPQSPAALKGAESPLPQTPLNSDSAASVSSTPSKSSASETITTLDPEMLEALKTLQDELIKYIKDRDNKKTNELRTFFGGVDRNKKVNLAKELLDDTTLIIKNPKLTQKDVVKKLETYLKQDKTLNDKSRYKPLSASRFGSPGRLSTAISEALKQIRTPNSNKPTKP